MIYRWVSLTVTRRTLNLEIALQENVCKIGKQDCYQRRRGAFLFLELIVRVWRCVEYLCFLQRKNADVRSCSTFINMRENGPKSNYSRKEGGIGADSSVLSSVRTLRAALFHRIDGRINVVKILK